MPELPEVETIKKAVEKGWQKYLDELLKRGVIKKGSSLEETIKSLEEYIVVALLSRVRRRKEHRHGEGGVTGVGRFRFKEIVAYSHILAVGTGEVDEAFRQLAQHISFDHQPCARQRRLVRQVPRRPLR